MGAAAHAILASSTPPTGTELWRLRALQHGHVTLRSLSSGRLRMFGSSCLNMPTHLPNEQLPAKATDLS